MTYLCPHTPADRVASQSRRLLSARDPRHSERAVGMLKMRCQVCLRGSAACSHRVRTCGDIASKRETRHQHVPPRILHARGTQMGTHSNTYRLAHSGKLTRNRTHTARHTDGSVGKPFLHLGRAGVPSPAASSTHPPQLRLHRRPHLPPASGGGRGVERGGEVGRAHAAAKRRCACRCLGTRGARAREKGCSGDAHAGVLIARGVSDNGHYFPRGEPERSHHADHSGYFPVLAGSYTSGAIIDADATGACRGAWQRDL